MTDNILKDFPFSIGMQVFVERRINNRSMRGTCSLVGLHAPDYLVVELPFAAGKPMFSVKGEKCIVRIMHEGSVLGFWAEIIRLITEPYPIMILEYPREVEEMYLRRSERLDCNIETELLIEKDFFTENGQEKKTLKDPELVARQNKLLPVARSLQGTILDLSEGGCQMAVSMLDPKVMTEEGMEARKTIPVKDRELYYPENLQLLCCRDRLVKMSFELPQPAPGKFDAVPCDVRWNKPHGNNLFLGIRFLDPDTMLCHKIRKIIWHQDKFFSRRYESPSA